MNSLIVPGYFLILVSICSCSSMQEVKETIGKYPDIGVVTTTGVGEAVYTYDKRGINYIDSRYGLKVNVTDSIKQEIIYSGLSKEVLKITYREYINDYARASFFQDATYDYAPPSSTIISFKGAQVEIIDANNNHVKYKILKGFGNEQLQPMSGNVEVIKSNKRDIIAPSF